MGSAGADLTGADGILVPYINTRKEAVKAVSCCNYPTKGTRSVYFPQASTNEQGLLGYVPNANKHVIVALQVETADCIQNIEEIASVPGVDILFLGQNDLCMSMGLFEKYVFPEMYTSPELNDATQRLIQAAHKNNVILVAVSHACVCLTAAGCVPVWHCQGGRVPAEGLPLHQHR